MITLARETNNDEGERDLTIDATKCPYYPIPCSRFNACYQQCNQHLGRLPLLQHSS